MNKLVAETLPPTLMTMEELTRRKDVAFVLGNSELEGFNTPPALRALLERHASGEITMEKLFEERDRLLAPFRVKS